MKFVTKKDGEHGRPTITIIHVENEQELYLLFGIPVSLFLPLK